MPVRTGDGRVGDDLAVDMARKKDAEQDLRQRLVRLFEEFTQRTGLMARATIENPYKSPPDIEVFTEPAR